MVVKYVSTNTELSTIEAMIESLRDIENAKNETFSCVLIFSICHKWAIKLMVMGTMIPMGPPEKCVSIFEF